MNKLWSVIGVAYFTIQTSLQFTKLRRFQAKSYRKLFLFMFIERGFNTLKPLEASTGGVL